MPFWVELVRWAHLIGATVLLGTGAGIAFFMVMAHPTQDARIIAHTAGVVVVADWIFNASAVIAQPITGALLAMGMGWSLRENWILVSLGLYVLTGVFWLPVVGMQLRMRNLARRAVADNAPLPEAYYKLYRTWFACGFPAFFSVLAIVWLTATRPQF
jgi:uncharacterized membrane protein